TLEHDAGRVLGVFVFVMTEELRLPLKQGGSTTLRRRLKQRGIEADECFWIANAARMAGRRRLDLRIDPPPDLCIEVDVTHSSLERLSIYAALAVPEVWRLEGDSLTFYAMEQGGSYKAASVSRTFQIMTPTVLMQFLQEARVAGDLNRVVGRFREWIRK